MSSEPQKAQNKKAHIRGVTALLVSTFFLGLSHGIGYPLTALTFERWGTSVFLAGVLAYAYISLLPTFGTQSSLSEASLLRLVTAFLWAAFYLPLFLAMQLTGLTDQPFCIKAEKKTHH